MKAMPARPEMVEKIAPALRKCALFRELDDLHLQGAAAQASLVQVETGEFLTREGAAAEAFFVLLNGQAVALIRHGGGKDEREVARLGASDTVGEVGLLLSQPYAASVKAATRLIAARFEAQFFEEMVKRLPGFGLHLAKALGRRLQQLVRLLPVPDYTEEEGGPSGEAMALLPREFLGRHRILPLRIDGHLLTLGFVGAPSPGALESIRHALPGMELRPVRIDASFFDSVMGAQAQTSAGESSKSAREAATGAVPAPPPLLERLLQAVVTEGASDLHLSAGHRPRWRIDGEMHEIADAPIFDPDTAFELLEPVIEERHRKQFGETNDVDLGYALPGSSRFRVNVFRDANGTGAVFRSIPSKTLTLEQLGMPPIVSQFCAEPKGLVLVTGPTGSGKSTTLAAMVDLINRTRREHIITLEDPIEFVHASQLALVTQREVGSHTQFFARALRAALREDPDIVLVGEMRDLETVSLAMETANTGHLVMATLHTATAILTVDRVVGLYPPEQQSQIRSLLADVLRGVISQNLCRRVGGGRVAALEILVVNAAVSNLIREGKTNQIATVMQTGKSLGNQPLNDSLASLVRDGKVEYEEALSKAVDKADLQRRVKK